MKSILISIRPKLCEKIVNGDVSILVRKKVPNETPFKVYIYCTKDKPYLYRVDDDDNFELARTLRPYVDEYVKDYNEQNGKVFGEFICDKVYLIKNQGSSFSVADEEQSVTNEIARQSCLDYYDMVGYLGNKDGYGWHISDLNIYGKPKELSEFISPSKAKKCVDYCVNGICSNLGYEELCGAIRRCEYKKITRPPQNYIYVEEQENSNE